MSKKIELIKVRRSKPSRYWEFIPVNKNMNKPIYSYSPLREKRKKQKRERMEKVVVHSILLAILLFIIATGSICTGDYEGDPDAVCVRIINLKNEILKR